MDITKLNFKEKLPDIKSAITNASFLAIDCEFTGLNIDSEACINSYDTFPEYYSKLRRSVGKFLVLQFGLCAFQYDDENKHFNQKCYNFYLFPRPISKIIPDQRFICQASSVDFLANHNFNFNKVFKDGISYLNSKGEEKYKEILEERRKNKANLASSGSNSTLNSIPIPNEDKPFIEDVMKLIRKFSKTKDEEILLPTCNSFRRRLIYQTAAEKFGSSVQLETRGTDKERVLYAMKPLTAEKITKKEKEKLDMNIAELEDAVGFARIIQFISESGKLIVGHNLSLDLLHIIDKFLVNLPENYYEFKQCASCLFPSLIDTKLLAHTTEFKDEFENTVLSKLLSTLRTKKKFTLPEIVIDENCEGYVLDDDRQHEAGYDAFITGVCFLGMAQYLDKSPNYFLPTSNVLKPYLNKICILKLIDCGYINLSGADPSASRDHVLHMTFPKEWVTSDITQLFSPYGNVHIAWINDTSAYIALHRKELAGIALKALTPTNDNDSTAYTLLSFNQYHRMKNNIVDDLNTNNTTSVTTTTTQKPPPSTTTALTTAPADSSHLAAVSIADVTSSISSEESSSTKQYPTLQQQQQQLHVIETELVSHFQSKKRRREPNFGEVSKKGSSKAKPSSESIATKMTKMFDENALWD